MPIRAYKRIRITPASKIVPVVPFKDLPSHIISTFLSTNDFCNLLVTNRDTRIGCFKNNLLNISHFAPRTSLFCQETAEILITRMRLSNLLTIDLSGVIDGEFQDGLVAALTAGASRLTSLRSLRGLRGEDMVLIEALPIGKLADLELQVDVMDRHAVASINRVGAQLTVLSLSWTVGQFDFPLRLPKIEELYFPSHLVSASTSAISETLQSIEDPCRVREIYMQPSLVGPCEELFAGFAQMKGLEFLSLSGASVDCVTVSNFATLRIGLPHMAFLKVRMFEGDICVVHAETDEGYTAGMRKAFGRAELTDFDFFKWVIVGDEEGTPAPTEEFQFTTDFADAYWTSMSQEESAQWRRFRCEFVGIREP